MRLFTAIELPADVRAAVAAAATPWLRSFEGCRTVAEENLHVTVRFLGETTPERLAGVVAALGTAASSAPAAPLRIAGFGAFPDLRRPRVLWARVEDAERRTHALERAVTAALSGLGFPPEDRPWSPHVTIARIADPRRGGRGRRRGRGGPPGPTSEPAAPPPAAPLGPPFVAARLTLFESLLGPAGPRYRPVERFPLAGAAEPPRDSPQDPPRVPPAGDRPPLPR
jgi:2'-5' RNA ligase